MKVPVLLGCFLAVAFAHEEQEGNATVVPADGRIINGQPARRGAYPWHAILNVGFQQGSALCGGALISDEWVLTAAHCLLGATQVEVIMGTTSLTEFQPGRQSIDVSVYVIHEQYNPSTISNDVAVAKLSRPVPLSTVIRPIKLPKPWDFLAPNSYVWVTGFGKTSDQSSVSDTLNTVQLRVISNGECRKYYRSDSIQAGVVCCDGSQNKGTCSGDSGGSAVQYIAGHWRTVAISSFVSAAGCTEGAPTGFTRVAYYLDFIRAHTGLS